MVDVKIRTGEFGKVNNNIDIKIEGSLFDVLATMIELECTVEEIILSVEEKSRLNIREAFIENLTNTLIRGVEP